MSEECRVWDTGKSSLELVRQKIIMATDIDSATLNLAVILDTKFDKCEETMQK